MAQSGPDPTSPADPEKASSARAEADDLYIDSRIEQDHGEVRQRVSPQEDAEVPSRQAENGASQAAPSRLSVDKIMSRVRAELARRRVKGEFGAPMPAAYQLPRWRPASPRLAQRSQYVLTDFLGFEDADFIEVVYQALLRHPPDPQGRSGYLHALRSGARGKVELLGEIRFSEEGRKHAVHVDGLLLPYKLHRWRRLPVFGWLLGMAMAIYRLPRLAARLQGIEATAAHKAQDVGRLVDRLDDALELRFNDIDCMIDGLRADLAQSSASRAQALHGLAEQLDRLQETLALPRDAVSRGEPRQSTGPSAQRPGCGSEGADPLDD